MSKLEVVCGPMFAGKTEELIRRVKRVVLSDHDVSVYKPAMDTRYGASKIVSHAKTSLEKATGIKPIPLEDAGLIDLTPIKLGLSANTRLVAFDEAQFFEFQRLDAIINQLLDQGIRVLCAGLDLDSFGKPFGSMPLLLAKADEILKLKAVCVICGDDANRTYRKATDNTAVNFIGGSESYEPRCLECWLQGPDAM